VEIVKRSDKAKGSEVLPMRWVVDHRTVLPVWVSKGPHSLNVRAVGDRLLFPGSSGERVDLLQANQSRHSFDAPSAALNGADGRWRRTWSGPRIPLC
jgi:hypothetical protein